MSKKHLHSHPHGWTPEWREVWDKHGDTLYWLKPDGSLYMPSKRRCRKCGLRDKVHVCTDPECPRKHGHHPHE